MKNKKNQLFIFYNTMIKHLSGGDTKVIELSKRFQKFFNVKIILSEDSIKYFAKDDYSSLVLKKTIKFRQIIGLEFGILITYVIRTIQAFFIKINIHEKSILYASSDLFPDVLPVLWHKIFNRKVKYVQSIHHFITYWRIRDGNKFYNFISYYLQHISHSLIRRYANIILTDNSLVRDELCKRGFKNRIEVVGVGINFEEILAIDRIGVKKYEGVFMGRLQFSKGILDVIEIWKQVCKEIPFAILVIIGTGLPNDKKAMIKKINEYQLEKNIIFTGYLDRIDLIKTLKQSKVFIYPTHEEGWGIAAAEAMACGLPVVAYNLPVFKEVFPRGMITNNIYAYEKFAKNVLWLLNDTRKWKQISNEALKMAKNYSWENVTNREMEILRTL